MRKPNYPLRKYQRAVEAIAEEKGLAQVRVIPNKGSAVRFELFEQGADVPSCMWVIHHAHNRQKIVWSRENYKKAAQYLGCSLEEFVARVESL